jgi:hypothetical protein
MPDAILAFGICLFRVFLRARPRAAQSGVLSGMSVTPRKASPTATEEGGSTLDCFVRITRVDQFWSRRWRVSGLSRGRRRGRRGPGAEPGTGRTTVARKPRGEARGAGDAVALVPRWRASARRWAPAPRVLSHGLPTGHFARCATAFPFRPAVRGNVCCSGLEAGAPSGRDRGDTDRTGPPWNLRECRDRETSSPENKFRGLETPQKRTLPRACG